MNAVRLRTRRFLIEVNFVVRFEQIATPFVDRGSMGTDDQPPDGTLVCSPMRRFDHVALSPPNVQLHEVNNAAELMTHHVRRHASNARRNPLRWIRYRTPKDGLWLHRINTPRWPETA